MAQEQPPGDVGGGYARGEHGIGVDRLGSRDSRPGAAGWLGGEYTNFSVRQYRQSTPRMRPGDRTGRPAAVIIAAPGAGLVAGPVIGLAAFDAETASGEERMVRADPGPLRAAQDSHEPAGKANPRCAITDRLACRSPRRR